MAVRGGVANGNGGFIIHSGQSHITIFDHHDWKSGHTDKQIDARTHTLMKTGKHAIAFKLAKRNNSHRFLSLFSRVIFPKLNFLVYFTYCSQQIVIQIPQSFSFCSLKIPITYTKYFNFIISINRFDFLLFHLFIVLK